jgi:choline kinase
MSKFIKSNVNIDKNKLLTEFEQNVVEISLKYGGRKLIHKELKPLKNDYIHDFDRGTVQHTPKCRNYTFHKVVIPDGTVIRNSNFSQKEPHTVAIIGNFLHFIECNLTNVEIADNWIIEDCNTAQIRKIKKYEIDNEGKKEIIVSHQVEQKDKTFLEINEDKITVLEDDYDNFNLGISEVSNGS